MKLIILIGLKRSGNHGITNLILKNQKNYLHLNDLTDFTYENFQNFSKKQSNIQTMDQKWCGFKNKDLLLISLENIELNAMVNKICNFKEKKNIILLIRNPFNNLASAYKYFIEKKIGNGLFLLQQMKILWKQYCQFILKNQSFYHWSASTSSTSTCILYDKFYSNLEYRKQIFKELEIEYKEEHLNEITGYGRSFFDLNAKNTDKQDIFNRWKYFKDDKYFIQYVLNDSELLRLWNSVCRKYNIELMEC